MKHILGLIMMIVAASANAAELSLDAQPHASNVTFSGTQGAVHAGGEFSAVEARLVVDAKTQEPLRMSFATDLSTLRFTEGGVQEQMLLSTVVSSLPQSVARFTSSAIERTKSGYVAQGTVRAFGKDFAMKVPFALERISGKGLRASGVLKDRGSVLPFEVPGLAGEFSGVVKFTMLFSQKGQS